MVLGGKDARLPPRQLEGRPYAVKRVTFSTAGYYASARRHEGGTRPRETGSPQLRAVLHVVARAELDDGGQQWRRRRRRGGGGTVVPIEDDDCGERRDDVRGGYHAAHHRRRDVVDDIDGGGGGPKLLTDIERVVDGLHDAGEIDDLVEQLEAILYGGRGGDGDGNGDDDNNDGFDWTTSSSLLKKDHRSSVQPSFDRSERKDAAYDGDG